MTFSSTVLALPGLLAFYRHGEASGDVMVDSSGNTRDGVYRPAPKHPTLGATGLLVGDPDTAISFDGADDVAITGYSTWMDTATLGLFARIKPSSVSGTRIIHARDNGSGSATNRLWQFRISAGKLQLIFWDATHTLNTVNGATTLVAGTTYSVGADYDGTTARLYLNGVEDGTLTRSGALRTSGASLPMLFTVGVAGDEASNKYAGVIDEAVWCGQAVGASGHAQLHADATGSAPAPAALAANLSATASLTVAAPKVTTHLAAALSAESSLSANLTIPGAPLSLAASLSAVGNLAAALTLVPGVVVVETSTRYANDGYGYDGMAAVYYEDAIAPTPAHINRSKVMQVHQSMSAPNLVNGVPR